MKIINKKKFYGKIMIRGRKDFYITISASYISDTIFIIFILSSYFLSHYFMVLLQRSLSVYHMFITYVLVW